MKTSREQWQTAALSETGPVRDENQDRMRGTRVQLGDVYIVADGMGGHRGGALAAQLTVDGLCQHLDKVPPAAQISAALEHAFQQTNRSVYEKAHCGDPATAGMGSTATVLLLAGGVAHVAHVGDSRAYLYRNGRLRRLTKDHTRAQKMVDAGMLKPDEARDHPSASVLERAVGTKPAVEADIAKGFSIKTGDGILLCSDGLSGFASDAEIERVLRQAPAPEVVPKALFELALKNKSTDNVTVQFLQYGGGTSRGRKKLFYGTVAAGFGIAVLVGLFQFYSSFLQERAARALKEAQQEYANAKTAADGARQRLSALQSQLGDSQQKKQALEQEVTQLNAQVEAAKKEHDAAMRRQQAAGDRIQTLEKQVGKPPNKSQLPQ